MTKPTILVDHRTSLCSVRDQGARQTCLAQAATAAHEFLRRDQLELSVEYLHFFANKKGIADGISFEEVAESLRECGQPTELECPYQCSNPPPGWSPSPVSNVYRCESGQQKPSARNLERLITAGQIPVLGIRVPTSFLHPKPPWIISTGGEIRGYHAVVGVGTGHSTFGRMLLVRNSWGEEWGDKGHAWLGEDFLSEHLAEVLVLRQEGEKP